MDAARLEFPDAAFDVALAPYVISVVPHPEQALDEAWRVLEAGRGPDRDEPLRRLGGASRGRRAPDGDGRRLARLASELSLFGGRRLDRAAPRRAHRRAQRAPPMKLFTLLRIEKAWVTLNETAEPDRAKGAHERAMARIRRGARTRYRAWSKPCPHWVRRGFAHEQPRNGIRSHGPRNRSLSRGGAKMREFVPSPRHRRRRHGLCRKERSCSAIAFSTARRRARQCSKCHRVDGTPTTGAPVGNDYDERITSGATAR